MRHLPPPAASMTAGLTTMMYAIVRNVVIPARISFRQLVPCRSNSKYLRIGGPPPYGTEYFSIILPTIKPPSCSGMITSSAPEFRMAWAYLCRPARVMILKEGFIAFAVTVM